MYKSYHIRKINICGHSGTQTIVVAGQTNLDPKHLFDPVRDSVHVARRKLGLPIYLLDDAIEIRVRKRIDTDAHVLAQFDQTQPGFRHVNTHPEMAGQKQRGSLTIWRQHIADLDTE